MECHAKQVVLMFGGVELKDVARVGDVFQPAAADEQGNPDATPVVSVLQIPCQIKPSDYESYIDRTMTSCLAVHEIRYPFGYPADLKDDHQGRDEALPSKDPKRLKRYRESHQGSRIPTSNVTFPEPTGVNIN